MRTSQPELFAPARRDDRPLTLDEFRSELEGFCEFGKHTIERDFPDSSIQLPVYVNEFWTAKQRAAHSLHEVSYRACFKPQLPRFFIDRLTSPGDVIYDPFMGRGTTLVEAALRGRVPVGCDINPLSDILIRPRLSPPSITEISDRLEEIDLERDVEVWEELLVFYHPRTLRALSNLKDYLLKRAGDAALDGVDAWIRMVATNRLTGHSSGFFSVYTLPPNQAVSIQSQQRINEKRGQIPPERDVPTLILKKSRSLMRSPLPIGFSKFEGEAEVLLITGSSDSTPQIPDDSVSLVVTSPPFLDVVNYQADNWLRCWFNGIDVAEVQIWQLKDPADWQARMQNVFTELKRTLAPGGHVAFEVGEVRNGKLLLETLVVPAAMSAGLVPLLVVINDQVFTKTSNCWGVDNLKKGTNTNRIVVLEKT